MAGSRKYFFETFFIPDWINISIMIVKEAILLMAIVAVVASNCPHEKIYNTGNCSYRIQCTSNIRGIRLPDRCIESSNDQVTVDLTLTDAVEHYNDYIDKNFLPFITTLRIYGYWPKTKLSLLEYTTRLENLYFNGNDIETISGKPFFYLSSLDILDLSYNKLSHIDNLFRFELQSNKLRKLNLGHNIIEDIAADAFAELNSLIELDLSYNLIANLNEEPFSNLTSLQVLRLNNNNITNLNGAVNYLQNLKHLYLKGNQINNIDVKSLKIIYLLETFDVSANHLDNINSIMLSRNWKHLSSPAVCKIILSGNHITFVPNATATEITTRYARHLVRGRSNADVLTEVDLSNNDITNIEYDAFQSLNKLTSLNLSNNKLIGFVVSANDVAFVKFLNLSGNFITQLYYESFSGMHKLQNLDLSNNNLITVPDETFRNNYNLRHVNMTYNEIEKLDNLHINMFHLNDGVLDLSNNELSILKIRNGEGLRLTSLLLHSNNITDPSLVDLYFQTDLRSLDMSRNRIREIKENSLRLPVSLAYLDLSCNQIEKIAPSAFLRIWHLETLRLAHNQLKTIEYGSFHGLSSLMNLDLSYNKLRYLDSNSMMDLKSLKVLSLRSNELQLLYDEGWYGHKTDLKVILDGNNLTCEWLATALKNHNNGYSKMRPTVLARITSGHSLEGIPCKPAGIEKENLRVEYPHVMADERLLLVSQKILEAVQDQTYYLKKYVWRSIQEDVEKVKSFS